MNMRSQTRKTLGNYSTRSIVVQVITVVGGLALFGAWIAQNYCESKWISDRMYLEKTQFLVQMEQNNADSWQIQMNLEATREPLNRELYLSACFNFVRSITNLLAWEEARVADDSLQAAPIAVKNLAQSMAKELLEKKDLEGLLRLVRAATEIRARFRSKLDRDFFARMAASKKNADWWNSLFLCIYTFGSILIGVRWFMTSILRWPAKLNRDGPDLGESEP
jgi:hypothetical protein